VFTRFISKYHKSARKHRIINKTCPATVFNKLEMRKSGKKSKHLQRRSLLETLIVARDTVYWWRPKDSPRIIKEHHQRQVLENKEEHGI